MPVRVAVLSDVHLAGPEDPNQQRFVRFLGALAVDRLCLLGDIFQHWWHFGREPFPQYRPVVEALRRFNLTFVPGNHDWHAAAFFRDELGARVGATIQEDWDGTTVYMTHGDEVDRSPGYRAISLVLRGRPFAAAVDTMGPERAWRFLGSLTHPPRGTPDPVLVEAQKAAARRITEQGVALVVNGHTHAPGVHRWESGTYVNLGDWVHHHTWLLVTDGVPELRRE
jgi:UDP-2,3-diacylglucosamine pyrophosphatase LpxH